MDVWGWIVVYAVGLTVLQLLVYRYLLNSGGSLTRRVGTPFGDGDGDSTVSNGSSRQHGNRPPDAPGDADRDATPSPAPGVAAWPEEHPRVRRAEPVATDGRRCPHCGVENERDETFTRCWNCTGEL